MHARVCSGREVRANVLNFQNVGVIVSALLEFANSCYHNRMDQSEPIGYKDIYDKAIL